MSTRIALALLLGAVLTPMGAHADHEEAYELRRSGEILPLESIVERAQASVPGRLLEAELEHCDDRLIYEIELATPEGRHVRLRFDAKTGEQIEQR